VRPQDLLKDGGRFFLCNGGEINELSVDAQQGLNAAHVDAAINMLEELENQSGSTRKVLKLLRIVKKLIQF
jgi:hypothetical protein